MLQCPQWPSGRSCHFVCSEKKTPLYPCWQLWCLSSGSFVLAQSHFFVPHRLSVSWGRSSGLLSRYWTGEALLCCKSYYHTLLCQKTMTSLTSAVVSPSQQGHMRRLTVVAVATAAKENYIPRYEMEETASGKSLGSRWKERRGSLNFLSKDNNLILARFFKRIPQQSKDNLKSLFAPQRCWILGSDWSKSVE